jgi:hypothetical protein
MILLSKKWLIFVLKDFFCDEIIFEVKEIKENNKLGVNVQDSFSNEIFNNPCTAHMFEKLDTWCKQYLGVYR